jgi:phosphoglycolate phosphatase-like HAD superfamily hydrolase
MPPQKHHLAVFDIDGTLTDSVAVFQASYLKALQPFRFAEIDTNWGEYEHHTDSWIFQKIYHTNHDRLPDEEERQKFSDELMRIYADEIRKQPIIEITGAARFVDFLEKETSWAIAYATGSLRPPARTKLDACGFRYSEETLATASEFLTREDIVDAAIEGAKKFYGSPAFETVISFGDGLWDYKTAQKMKLDFIGIGKGPKADYLLELGNIVFCDFRDAAFIRNHMQKHDRKMEEC